jgi:hypothetical protein
MCPTYSRGGRYDAKSELFSFGMVVPEVLTGKLQKQADGDLYVHYIEEKKEDIAEAADERAGRWPENVMTALAGVIRTCLALRTERYDSMAAPLGILVELEQKHCGASLDLQPGQGGAW